MAIVAMAAIVVGGKAAIVAMAVVVVVSRRVRPATIVRIRVPVRILAVARGGWTASVVVGVVAVAVRAGRGPRRSYP